MNVIQKYFRYRQSLIDQYVRGDMSKAEYLMENFNAITALHIKPFKILDNVDKCLYNYQYYNAMAKDSMSRDEGCWDGTLRRERLEEANCFYSKKDEATLAALKLMEYRNVYGYFIQVRSKYLKSKLFEIVLEDYNMILHSANTLILNRLRKENAFFEETRKSLIDGYINQKY